MAFVSSGSLAGAKVGVAEKCEVTRRAPLARGRVVVRAEKNEKLAFLKDLGWTESSEVFNGRLAMMGFVIAVLTEALNPDHPTVAQQLSNLVGLLSR